MNDEIKRNLKDQVRNWLGGIVLAALPLGLLAIANVWLEFRDLSAIVRGHDQRLVKFEEFKNRGDRCTLARCESMESRLDRLDAQRQQHEVGAAGWIERIQENTRDIRNIGR